MKADERGVALFDVCIRGFGDDLAGKDEIEGIPDRLWGAWTDRRRMIRRREEGGGITGAGCSRAAVISASNFRVVS